MNGSAFLINNQGLICTNDADLITERVLVKDESGATTSSKHTEVIRLTNYMSICGLISQYEDAYCQFLFEDSRKVQTFSVIVSTFTEDMIILNLKALNLHNKEVTETIKKKIKEEIKNGRC